MKVSKHRARKDLFSSTDELLDGIGGVELTTTEYAGEESFNPRRLSWADLPTVDNYNIKKKDSNYKHDLDGTRIPSSPRTRQHSEQSISSLSSIQSIRNKTGLLGNVNPDSPQSVLESATIGKHDITKLQIQEDDTIEDVIIRQKMNRSILCLRTLTFLTLIAATIIVAVLTYRYSRLSETRVFKSHYKDSVEMIEHAIKEDMNNKINAAQSLSFMCTSQYGISNEWPNVTISSFQQQAKVSLAIANCIALSFNPIITNETRVGWESYAAETAHDELNVRSCDTCRIVSDGIFQSVNDDSHDGIKVYDPGYSPQSRYPYVLVPIWQIYPIEKYWKEIMLNLHAEENDQHALDDMLRYKVPTITGLTHNILHNDMNLISVLYYPVMDTFQQDSKVLGSIAIFFTWADMLQHILPSYIQGLFVVLEKIAANNETDNEIFTYDVRGSNVTLLGEGDFHEAKYNEYENVAYVNVAQDSDLDFLVTYKLSLFPSQEFEHQYFTIKPLVMTLVVFSIFILTSVIFLLYDYLVNNRQNALMKIAHQSGQIVDSMFPSSVHARLFSSSGLHLSPQTISKDEGEVEFARSLKRSSAARIKRCLRSSFQNKADTRSDRYKCAQSYIQTCAPIADVFHNTTIMFADIVSFTEWSSEHSPEDVFYLLESLFLEFDKAAEKWGVFKLGTIGKSIGFRHLRFMLVFPL